MQQYYVLTLEPRCGEVFRWIESHQLDYEVHLNRTRFWIPKNSHLQTEFLLRFSECCGTVDESLDTLTGMPKVGVLDARPK